MFDFGKHAHPKIPLSFLEDFDKRKDVKFRSNCFQCFHLFLKSTYYFGISQVNPVISKDGQLSLKTSKLQRVPRLLLTLCAICVLAYRAKNNLATVKKIKDNPAVLYTIADSVIGTCGPAMVLRLIYKREGLSYLYTSTFKMSVGASPTGRHPGLAMTKWTILSALLCFLPIVQVVRLGYATFLTVFEALKGTPEGLQNFYSLPGLGIYEPVTNFVPPVLASVFCGTVLTTRMYITMLAFTALVIGYLGCVAVHQIATEFQDFLAIHKNATFEQVSQAYIDVKTLLGDINVVTRNINLAVVLEGLSGLSGYLTKLFDEEDWAYRSEIIVTFIVFLTSFGLASEANKKMIPKFVFDNRKAPSFRNNVDVSIFLTEVSNNNQLGLQAHAFTVTYSFMATILSTAVTYVFILLQFQATPGPL